MKTIYETLSKINVNDKTEKKGSQTYLSWAHAWAEIKKFYPAVQRKVYEDHNGFNYFTDGKTCWVKVGVIIDELEHIDYLPIMDMRNNAIQFERVTSFDVNKAIQRSTAKAIAMHGLGLYIYAGEDMPEAPVSTKDSVVSTLQKDGFKIATEADMDAAGVIDFKKLTEFMKRAVDRGDSWETTIATIEAKKGELAPTTKGNIHNEFNRLVAERR